MKAPERSQCSCRQPAPTFTVMTAFGVAYDVCGFCARQCSEERPVCWVSPSTLPRHVHCFITGVSAE